MIYKRMSGRLGNQMFQYAAVRNYQLKFRKNDDIILDFSSVYKLGKEEDGFTNSLKGFNLPKNVKFVDSYKMDFIPSTLFNLYKFMCMILKIFGNGYNYKKRRRRLEDIIFPFYSKNGLIIYTDGFKEIPNINKKNIYFFGFFESVDYFKESQSYLVDEFTPKNKINNNDFINSIITSNSVCVSVRAGDFLSSKFINDYYVCKPIYFEKAIEEISKKSNNLKFFVFSDDIDWAKKNINFKNCNFCCFEQPGLNVYEKLFYMSNCKNFILSNSSFSFWAQFLSKNKNKNVIAPSQWNNIGEKVDIYEKDWQLIKIKKEN